MPQTRPTALRDTLAVAFAIILTSCSQNTSPTSNSSPGSSTPSNSLSTVFPADPHASIPQSNTPTRTDPPLAPLLKSLQDRSNPLRTNILWKIGTLGGHEAANALGAIASNSSETPGFRADALMAAANAAVHSTELAESLVRDPEPAVRHTALFILGRNLASDPEPRPNGINAWLGRLGTGGDPASGRRIFRSPQAGCARCHVAEGHGSAFGPALGTNPAPDRRTRWITSILAPADEVAPEYQPWQLQTQDEQTFTGLLLRDVEGQPIEFLIGAGRQLNLPRSEVAALDRIPGSIMPDGLADTLSVSDFRDLLAYLELLAGP